MHAPFRPVAPRFNNYHGPKARVLGNPANHVPPAWRANGQRVPSGPRAAPPPGSKILISNLPPDVSEREVEELFQKTVGPLREVLLVYNSQGRSKGMAVVAFQRAGDAAVAREKYNDKVVDGRRPIKIEIVTDEVPSAQTPSAAAPQLPSLLQRLGVKVPTGIGKPSAPVPTAPRPRAVAATVNNATRAVMAQPRRRVKKGARRVNKRPAPKTAADLDKEMDAYRAGSSEAA